MPNSRVAGDSLRIHHWGKYQGRRDPFNVFGGYNAALGRTFGTRHRILAGAWKQCSLFHGYFLLNKQNTASDTSARHCVGVSNIAGNFSRSNTCTGSSLACACGQ